MRLRQAIGRFLSGFVIGYTIRHRELSARATALSGEDAESPVEIEEDEVSDQLLLELVERIHERFVDRLNALDTALIGLMAAILAIAAITVEKLAHFQISARLFEWSLGVCAIGWLIGNVPLLWPVREPLDPANLLGGVEVEGIAGIQRATSQIARAYKDRQWLRLAKVGGVAVALALLIAGVVLAMRSPHVILDGLV